MRCVILLVALLAIMSSIPPVMAGKLTVNSTLIAQYWGRGHTFGSMDTQSFDAALIELASERSAATEGGLPTCGGLVNQLCQPCPDGGPEGFCQAMIDECSKIFCSPMCKRTTWKCKINFGSFQQEANEQQKYEDALCAHFINEGCSTILDCCPRDDFLRQDVADKVNRDAYPTPALPTPSCIHDPTSQAPETLCEKCNAEVKVELEKLECGYPKTPGPGPSFLEVETTLAPSRPESSIVQPKLTLEELYARDEALLTSLEHAVQTRERREVELNAVMLEMQSQVTAQLTHSQALPQDRAYASLGNNLAKAEIAHLFGTRAPYARSIATKVYRRSIPKPKRGDGQITPVTMLESRTTARETEEGGEEQAQEAGEEGGAGEEQAAAEGGEAGGEAGGEGEAAAEGGGEAGAEGEAAAEGGGEAGGEAGGEGGDAAAPAGGGQNANARRFGAGVPGFPGKPTYFGLNDRCNMLAKRAEGMFGTMKAAFQEKVCNCMGCCTKVGEPTCFFPLWEVIGHAPGGAPQPPVYGFTGLELSSHITRQPSQTEIIATKTLEKRRESRWAKYWEKVRKERSGN